MKLHFVQVLTLVISSAEAAGEVAQTHELVFAQRSLTLGLEAMSFDHPGGLLSSPYGEYWRQMRKICVVELLSPKRVMSFKSVREEQVWSLIESIISTSKNSSSQNVINFSEMIISMTIATISTTVYGNKCRGHDEYVVFLKELLTFGTGFTLAAYFPSTKILGHVTGIKATLQ